MTLALQASVGANIQGTVTNTKTGGQTTIDNIGFTPFSKSLSHGTGAINTADLIYAVQGTLAGAASVTIDLVGGVTDAFGNTITMARLKYLIVLLTTDTNSSGLTIGNATNPINLFSAPTATHTIGNGGVFVIGNSGAVGIPMVAATSDALKLLNADATVVATYQVIAIGSSA